MGLQVSLAILKEAFAGSANGLGRKGIDRARGRERGRERGLWSLSHRTDGDTASCDAEGARLGREGLSSPVDVVSVRCHVGL